MLKFVSGSSQRLQSVSSFLPSNPGSVSFWITPTDLSGTPYILYINTAFRIYFSGGYLRTGCYRGNSKQSTSVTLFSANTLYHVVVSWDGTGETVNNIYVNGALDKSASDNDGIPASGTLYIASTSSSDYCNGNMEDLRFYNRLLPLSEIQTIYAAKGLDNILYGLQHRWLMNEKNESAAATGTGTIINSTGDFNCTPSGSPVYGGGNLTFRRRLR